MGKYPMQFNCIIIIQSMTSPRPGDELELAINHAANKLEMGRMGNLIDVSSKTELLGFLASVTDKVKNDGVKPMIHFEMHGSEEGIGLTNGEIATWRELQDSIRAINIAMNNSLFVSLSTCYGAFFLTLYNHKDPCAFYGYIGPLTALKIIDLEISFNVFFKTLLEKETFSDAIIALQNSIPENKNEYVFINCYEYYDMLIERFKERHNDPKQKAKELERFSKLYRPLFSWMDEKQFRNHLEAIYESDIFIKEFEKMKKVFLHQEKAQIH